jgi:hypothetical protein
MNERHSIGGTAIKEKLDLLFSIFPENTCPNDVQAKVAVLNTLYKTSIKYILPVAEKINGEFMVVNKSKKSVKVSPIDMVDRIATASGPAKRPTNRSCAGTSRLLSNTCISRASVTCQSTTVSSGS